MKPHDEQHHHGHHGTPHETPEMPQDIEPWHQHAPEEGVPREEHAAHANITALLITFAVITVGTVIFCVIIGIYTIGQVNRLKAAGEVEGLAAVNTISRTYKRDALASQDAYGWTADGKVRLPIDQAMQMVIEQHGEAAQR
jgi:hypothetical protein